MDPIMKAMKAVHSVASAGASVSQEDLDKQRAGQDLFSKLATPPLGIHTVQEKVDTIEAEWVFSEHFQNKKHVILYCHGGGYTCGSLKYARILAGKLALSTGIKVFSFEYRLAPEHPYPAAKEDVLKVWDYLLHLGYGADNIIVAGDSAGGNLALLLCLTLKKQKRFMPKALLLLSPWTDMTMSAMSYASRKEEDPLLTKEYIAAVRGAYAGDIEDFSNPEFSPLFGDLKGFPPTLIQVGNNEILLDDSRNLAGKLQSNGVLSRLELYEDGWHVFQQMPIRRAHRAMEKIAEFVNEII